MNLIDDPTLRSLVAGEFALANIKSAHAVSEFGHLRGKIALLVRAFNEQLTPQR